MNIFLFETKRQYVSALIWTVALVLVLWGLTAGVYPSFQTSVAAIKRVVESFPPSFAEAFGVNVSNLFNFGGFYNFCFGYLSVMGAIMAASLGISLFAREGRAKCEDFLFTKPVSRGRIFWIKFLSGLVLLLAANCAYMIVALALGQANNTSMFLPALALFLTQLVMYAIGISCAIFARKIRSVSGMATIIGFGAFIVSALTNILNEPFMRYLDVLKYFEPAHVLSTGSYDGKFVFVATVVFVLALCVSYVRFTRKDTKSV